MPIKLNDFKQETYYKVDYEKLLDYFSQFRIFISKWNNKKYLKNWIYCFKQYDIEISFNFVENSWYL